MKNMNDQVKSICTFGRELMRITFLCTIQCIPAIIMLVIDATTSKSFTRIEYLNNILSVVLTDAVATAYDESNSFVIKRKIINKSLIIFACVLYSVSLVAEIDNVGILFDFTIVLSITSLFFKVDLNLEKKK